MGRLLLPLRRLRWQLTFSYILITLVAALTLQVATTVMGVVAPPKVTYATPAQILTNAMTFTEVPQLAGFLSQVPPDRHALGVWAEEWAQGFTFSKQGFEPESATTLAAPTGIPPESFGARDVALAILDADGNVLASAGGATSPIASVLASAPAQQAIHSALTAGAKPLGDKPMALADGRTVAAVPVLAGRAGPVLGALVVAAMLLQGPAPVTTPVLPQVAAALKAALPTGLALVLLASVVGTLFGVLASRGITHRLRRIALAADAWSRGEFQTTVRDTGRDELGQLAADLNLMAGQVQQLLAARQELAVVEERHRLARELHDSVKQQLFVMTMLVGAARTAVAEVPEAARTLAEAEHLAGQTQQELTALIHTLRPVALSGQGLGAALRALVDEWSQQTGIAAEARVAGEPALPTAAEQALFRIAQEALANVARHSGAAAVTVTLAPGPAGDLTLGIQDDGHGFDPQRQGSGTGLAGIRERAQELGGTLFVYSGGHGTRVEARLPALPVAAREAAAVQ
ncbi:MAG TPA: sensor histidine kinase [Ktedonobacterales bacterium]|nr:sensor histidine kinase [Ktedonobacterales bacterium]